MQKECDVCGNLFTANRSDAKFCSGRCRTINYRRGQGFEPQPARPLGDEYRAAEAQLIKGLDRISRVVDDDRWPRTRDKVNARTRLRNQRARLSRILDRCPSPDELPDSTVASLALPQSPKRGPRRKHKQVLESMAASLGGLVILAAEFKELDSSIGREDAAQLASELEDGIDAISRISSLLLSRAKPM